MCSSRVCCDALFSRAAVAATGADQVAIDVWEALFCGLCPTFSAHMAAIAKDGTLTTVQRTVHMLQLYNTVTFFSLAASAAEVAVTMERMLEQVLQFGSSGLPGTAARSIAPLRAFPRPTSLFALDS